MMKWIKRWQEQVILLPLLVFIAISGWMVLTVFDRTAGKDMLSLLVQLPILCAYVGAISGLSWLIRRRQRKVLTDEEQAALWNLLLAGNKPAMIIYITDFIVWLVAYGTMFSFFWHFLG